MIRSVGRTIVNHRMLFPGDAVLAGVSGGADSVALVHLLHRLAPEFSIKLGVAHFNHALRGEAADADQNFVAALAHRMALPFFTEKADAAAFGKHHGLCLEEAARKTRYGFLNRIAEKHGYNRIALGHHGDDNAELVLMFLLRGSGPLGLAGIPPVRAERIIRPLIETHRSEILRFLGRLGVDYVTDASNADVRYMRNRIRHCLIPELKASYNVNVAETLNRSAKILRSEDSWMDEMVRPMLEKSILEEGGGRLVIAADRVAGVHVAAKRRLLRAAIARVKGNLRRVGFSHIEAAVRLVGDGLGEGSVHLPDRIGLSASRGRLTIWRQSEPLRSGGIGDALADVPDFEYSISGPGHLYIKEIGAGLTLSVGEVPGRGEFKIPHGPLAFFDADKIRFPLIVRNLRPGDRFQPFGMRGTQKVKTFFINGKVQREQRRRIPLLVSGGEIVWVAGYRISDAVKLKPSTKAALKGELTMSGMVSHRE